MQLRAVVAEQTAGMQQTLLANGRLQEEVARLRGLLQQREAQAPPLPGRTPPPI